MSDLMKVGADWGGAGTFKPLTSAVSGAQRTADAHGRYLDAVLAGRVYFLSVAAGAPTAYVGAGGGSPLVAIHNPANSQKLFAVLMIGWAARVGASAAGNTGLAAWNGPSVIPTGTQTTPTNALSQAATGAAAKGFANAALTGSTTLSLALPLLEYQLIGATPAAPAVANCLFDVAGLLVAAPGNQIAIGMTTVPTSLTCDVAMYWEEIPYLTTV